MVEKARRASFRNPKSIDTSPGRTSIPAYKKAVFELGPREIRTLGRALGKAVAALEETRDSDDADDAQLIRDVLADWMVPHTECTAASIVFHEPGADDEDLGDERRASTYVVVGDPGRALSDVKSRVFELLEADNRWRRRVGLGPRNVYFGLSASPQQRHRQHLTDTFHGRPFSMQPLYETAVPEWVEKVEQGLIDWGLSGASHFRCENKRAKSDGPEGGHAGYWVYMVLVEPTE